ncbi:MAG: hypothetical protein N5P05_002534 [Chroococcopsis gigantea SAG 12.99]|jgi:hypothetical protein|nr:hypothetical protein [Chroococcopsis gigantea SAG 12.99]
MKKPSNSQSSGQTELMRFTEESYKAIKNTVGKKPAETGGILLGSRDDSIVRKFVFDDKGSTSRGGYDPDVDSLNRIIKWEWERNGLALLGFLHSHPSGVRRLSGDWGNGYGDLGYVRKIFRAIPALDKFLVPIVFSSADTKFEIIPYIVYRNNVENYLQTELVITFTDSYTSLPSGQSESEGGNTSEGNSKSKSGNSLLGNNQSTFNINDVPDKWPRQWCSEREQSRF